MQDGYTIKLQSDYSTWHQPRKLKRTQEWRWRRPQKWIVHQNEDNLKNEDNPKNEETLKNEDDLEMLTKDQLCLSCYQNPTCNGLDMAKLYS